MPVSVLDEENGSLELETHNTMENPVDGTGVTVSFCFQFNSPVGA